MPNPTVDEEVRLTIIIGTFLVMFFVLAILLLFLFFNKKNQLHQKEKQIIKAAFEQTILQSQLEIQEQTFNTISQEIHDNVGQILSLVKVQLNIMDENHTIDKPLLADAQDNVSKAMTDLRDIAKGLNSERIRIIGIVSTVEQEIQRINRAGIVHVNLQVSGTEQKTDGQKQLVLFRIIQECLQNIIKHAAASAVKIMFTYEAEKMKILINDNGKGFNFNKDQLAYNGLGLQNIFKRIDLIGGTVDINSILQEGTTIKLTIPYV